MLIRKPGDPLLPKVARNMKRAHPKDQGPKTCLRCYRMVKWSRKQRLWLARDKAGRFTVGNCAGDWLGKHGVTRDSAR